MTKLSSNVENIDIKNGIILTGLSNLQGNNWNGGFALLSRSKGEILAEHKIATGVTKAKFLPWSLQSYPIEGSSVSEKSISTSNSGSQGIIAAACDNGEIRLFHFYHSSLESTDIMDDTEDDQPQQQQHHHHSQTEINAIHQWEAHDHIVSSIIVDPYHPNENNHLLISAGWDGSIKLWDLETFENLTHFNDASYHLKDSHTSHVYDITFASYHPSMLLSGGEDRFVRIWDLRLPANHGCSMILEHHAPVTCLNWNNCDDNSFFSGTFDGRIHYHDIRFPTSLNDRICTASKAHRRRIRSLKTFRSRKEAYDPSHYCLLSADDDGFLAVTRFSQPEINEESTTKSSSSASNFELIQRLTVHKASISDLAIIEDGDNAVALNEEISLCTSSYDKTIEFTKLSI